MNRILFVEDDEALALGIEYTLQEEGYEVVRASTVKEGKVYFDKKDFDLVLLDINLPDGSGYDVCKYIKSIKDTPIIFLTALDEEVNVVLGLDMGGEDYITKPFRVRELLSRIKVVLRRNSKIEKNSMIIKCEDIILNTAKIEVLKKNERLALTAKEYKLLLIFMKNPGVMLSKDEILNELFEDEGAFVEDNTLSVYIKRLREKIEENPSKPEYVITKRGLGYMWNKDIQ
ncbi:MAG: response regulator transcription factor [Clostridium sp.]|nr:response regulator transcription factor [Clostridium sp.]MDU7082227.1 response regulator transcription factor [Clostridium sp.]